MAKALKYSLLLANGQQDLITSTMGGAGRMKIYSGTKPTGPDVGITTQVLLADLECGTPFAAAAVNGQIVVNAIAQGTGAATGTATWVRMTTSAGVAVFDGTVGLSTAGEFDFYITPSASIAPGTPVTVSSASMANGNYSV